MVGSIAPVSSFLTGAERRDWATGAAVSLDPRRRDGAVASGRPAPRQGKPTPSSHDLIFGTVPWLRILHGN